MGSEIVEEPVNDTVVQSATTLKTGKPQNDHNTITDNHMPLPITMPFGDDKHNRVAGGNATNL